MTDLQAPIIDLDDGDWEPMLETYRSMVNNQQIELESFVKAHPQWIIAGFTIPQLHAKFMPQDMANLFNLLVSWLKDNCKGGYQVFLGCIMFETRADAENYYTIWCVTKGLA